MQQDAHDLLHSMLNRLHEEDRELKNIKKLPPPISNEFRFHVQVEVLLSNAFNNSIYVLAEPCYMQDMQSSEFRR